MSATKPAYTEVASPSTVVRAVTAVNSDNVAVSIKAPYGAIKHLLSKKPLRRPNKTRATNA